MKTLKSISLSSLVALVLLAPTPSAMAATDTLAQYYGDASATTFTVPTVTAGYVVGVTVNGIPTSFTWSSSTLILLAAAPATGSLVNITQTTDARSSAEVVASKFMFPGVYNANGVTITAMFTTSGALDFVSTATLTSPADLTFTITGVAVGDVCTVGLPAAPTTGMIYSCFVSAADTVKVREFNATTGTVDAASATFRVFVARIINQLGV